MKADQERVKTLLTDTVSLLCKNGLNFSKQLKVQGLIGITVDESEVFVVHINELFLDSVSSEAADLQNSTPEPCNTSSSAAVNSQSTSVDLNNTESVPTSLPVKRKRNARTPSPVKISKVDVSCNSDEVQSEHSAVDNSLLEKSCVETGTFNTDQPKLEKQECASEETTACSIVIKEEKDEEDCMVLDSYSLTTDHKALSNSQELLQQIFNQFEPSGGEEFDGLAIDAHSMNSQILASDYASGVSGAVYPSTNAAVSENFGVWNSSTNRQRFLGQGSNAVEMQNENQINNVYDNQDVYALPKFLLSGRRSLTNVRRKRYECTLDSCGRQYQNTFDLYRHQRQKHHVPPEFYQQGKKQTFGIREIDPS